MKQSQKYIGHEGKENKIIKNLLTVLMSCIHSKLNHDQHEVNYEQENELDDSRLWRCYKT